MCPGSNHSELVMRQTDLVVLSALQNPCFSLQLLKYRGTRMIQGVTYQVEMCCHWFFKCCMMFNIWLASMQMRRQYILHFPQCTVCYISCIGLCQSCHWIVWEGCRKCVWVWLVSLVRFECSIMVWMQYCGSNAQSQLVETMMSRYLDSLTIIELYILIMIQVTFVLK